MTPICSYCHLPAPRKTHAHCKAAMRQKKRNKEQQPTGCVVGKVIFERVYR